MTQCSSRCQSSLQKLIDINIPIIYINDYDFARVDEIISTVLGSKKSMSGIRLRVLRISSQSSPGEGGCQRVWPFF